MSKPDIDGGVRGVPNVPLRQAASGRWSVADMYGYRLADNWPKNLGNFVQTGQVTLSGATVDVTIESVDLAHTFPIVNINTGETVSNNALVSADLVDATTLRLTRSGTTGDVLVAWQVVQNRSWSVQRVEGSSTGLAATDTISAVNVDESFIVVSNATTTTSGAPSSQVFGRFLNSTNVELFRNSTDGDFDAIGYVVSVPGANVQRDVTSFSGRSEDVTISSVDLDRTFVIGRTQGIRTDPRASLCTGNITTSTNLLVRRNNTTGTGVFAWQVVELPAADVINSQSSSDTEIVTNFGFDPVPIRNAFIFLTESSNSSTGNTVFQHCLVPSLISQNQATYTRNSDVGRVFVQAYIVVA